MAKPWLFQERYTREPISLRHSHLRDLILSLKSQGTNKISSPSCWSRASPASDLPSPCPSHTRAQEVGISAGFKPGSLGCPENSVAKVRLLAAGAIVTLLSLVVMADPKEPPASLRQGRGMELRRKMGVDRRGHPSGLTKFL